MLTATVCWPSRRPLRLRQHGDAVVTAEGSKQEEGAGFDCRFYEEFQFSICVQFQASILITNVFCLSASVCCGGPCY